MLCLPGTDACLPLGRMATGEELLPVNHLLPSQVSTVPSHVRRPMQDALQALPLSDYSPLDHHSGAFSKLAVCLYRGVVTPLSTLGPHLCTDILAQLSLSSLLQIGKTPNFKQSTVMSQPVFGCSTSDAQHAMAKIISIV